MLQTNKFYIPRFHQSLYLLLFVLAFQTTEAALGADASVSNDEIVLPVEIFIVKSAIPPLNAEISESEIEQFLQRVNLVWLAANIQWELQATYRHQLQEEAAVIAAMHGGPTITREFLLAAIVSGEPSLGVWQVYVTGDLTALLGAPGMYLPEQQKLIVSLVDPAGLNDPGRITAHELGHSLSLAHVPCVPAGNLMSPGCNSVNRIRLSESQILAARQQAKQGQPATRLQQDKKIDH